MATSRKKTTKKKKTKKTTRRKKIKLVEKPDSSLLVEEPSVVKNNKNKEGYIFSRILIKTQRQWDAIKKDAGIQVKNAKRSGGLYSSYIHGIDPVTREKKVVELNFHFL